MNARKAKVCKGRRFRNVKDWKRWQKCDTRSAAGGWRNSASTSRRGGAVGSRWSKGNSFGDRTPPSRARHGHAPLSPWRRASRWRAWRTRSTSHTCSSFLRAPTRCTSSPIRRRRRKTGPTPLAAPLSSTPHLSPIPRSLITTSADCSRATLRLLWFWNARAFVSVNWIFNNFSVFVYIN